MAAADKLLVIEGDERAGDGDELGVEDDFDGVVGGVEELTMPQMTKDGVVGVVGQVVGDDAGLLAAARGMNRALEVDHGIFGEQLFHCDQPAGGGGLEDAAAHLLLHYLAEGAQIR